MLKAATPLNITPCARQDDEEAQGGGSKRSLRSSLLREGFSVIPINGTPRGKEDGKKKGGETE